MTRCPFCGGDPERVGDCCWEAASMVIRDLKRKCEAMQSLVEAAVALAMTDRIRKSALISERVLVDAVAAYLKEATDDAP
jgi:hypothetical protein